MIEFQRVPRAGQDQIRKPPVIYQQSAAPHTSHRILMALTKCEECNHEISDEALVCPRCAFRRAKPSEEDKQLRRSLADTEVRNDWNKSIDHLLRDIQEESLDKTRPESETISRTLTRFAALQARLSKEADRTADKNLRVQRGAFFIAFIALLIAVISLVIQIIDKLKTEDNSIQIKYQRTYKNEELKSFEEKHSITNR